MPMPTPLSVFTKQLAKNDPDYANGQYETDMSREELYAEADRRLNGK